MEQICRYYTTIFLHNLGEILHVSHLKWVVYSPLKYFFKNLKERGINNLVILGQPFFHQTTLFFCEQWGYLKKNRGRMMEQRVALND